MNNKQLYFDCENIDSLHQNPAWWRILEESFPAHEREKRPVIEKAITQQNARAVSAWRGKDIVGIAMVQLLHCPPGIFLHYLAVATQERDNHIGGALFEFAWETGRNALTEAKSNPLGFLWELEIPALAASEEEQIIRKKRIEFYERHGAKILPCPYILPPLHREDTPTPMHLMFRPAFTGNMPTQEEILKIIKGLYKEKYAAVNGIANELLENLFNQIIAKVA